MVPPRANALLVVGMTLAILALSVTNSPVAYGHRMVQFSSQDELEYFLKNNSIYCRDGYTVSSFQLGDRNVQALSSGSSEAGSGSVPAHSETNNQVSGVDELDTVKNDGRYVYTVTGNKLVILKAYPATEAEVASTTVIVNGTIIGIFVRGDKLAVFGNIAQYGYYGEMSVRSASFAPYWGSSNTTVWVYDIADRSLPVLRNTITVEGSFVGARMIGDFVYLVASQPIPYCAEDVELPRLMEGEETVTMAATQVFHSDLEDYGHSFTNVAGFDISVDGKDPRMESFLLGTTGTIYVSSRAIFLTSYIYSGEEGTVLHRISIDEGTIVYEATGQVPGHVLNQFSMDEYNGFFRVATQTWNSGMFQVALPSRPSPFTTTTTTGTVSGPASGVYVLDEKLNLVGRVEGLGTGEQFHSARFMGDRAYLVTFKKIDPLFVVDLSEPRNPRVLGELKITGYSDYLHPFDDNFIIGIGKEADDQGSFAWYQGVKVALFDVSDPANPKEAGTWVIGDRGTQSPVLTEHKALLFDHERSLLVMPVIVAKLSGYNEPWAWGEPVWQGAYVFTVNPDVGVVFRGGITHLANGEVPSEYCYYGGYYGSSNCDRQVSRSLFIGEVLYTLSPTMIKMNSLTDLTQINSVSF